MLLEHFVFNSEFTLRSEVISNEMMKKLSVRNRTLFDWENNNKNSFFLIEYNVSQKLNSIQTIF